MRSRHPPGLYAGLIMHPREAAGELMRFYRDFMEEAPDEVGLSHYLEHMLFKGTPTRPPGSIDKLIEGLGGRSNAFTSFDYTHYDLVVPAGQLRALARGVGESPHVHAAVHDRRRHSGGNGDGRRELQVREVDHRDPRRRDPQEAGGRRPGPQAVGPALGHAPRRRAVAGRPGPGRLTDRPRPVSGRR